jgi:murein DD-endopeptidase MepM/ murein hydrolase activator NlpD
MSEPDFAQGQAIGYVGCTGHCFGDHLHFETRVSGSPVDPMGYL